MIYYVDSEAEGGDGENGKRVFLTFEGTDVKGRTGRLNKGDLVQFFITTDARTGKRRATQVCQLTLLPATCLELDMNILMMHACLSPASGSADLAWNLS